MTKVDKRRRNTRPSKYKPRTPAQLARKRELWAARSTDRDRAKREDEEAALLARLEELETALREAGQDGIHKQRHVTPLDDIEDDAKRFHVLKARVERLEALWSINKRRRETRGKIIIGGALLAEAGDAHFAGDDELLARLVDILDRRVERVQDRLTVRELLGNVPLALRPGGDLDEDTETALQAAGESLPDFDLMAETALAQEAGDALVPSELDPDYADLDQAWRAA
ncbi:hypothetical protein [Phenylobacterium sp. J367]|uniref:hypothetical protein n=1 Tax=Phenylobacterium sp. J367 TaxID=2898435 RepID=UPI002151C704|nr:hypothetical protein [Phenylobacterium sp. J367]MCR5881232.1 hypothetical protein [Phenylobacterium sp. J367]